MKPRNHHEKRAQAKIRAFYTLEDLVNFGRSPAEAQRMIDEGRHWIAAPSSPVRNQKQERQN